MTKVLFSAIAISALISLTNARGQDDPQPKMPLVPKAPERAFWKITTKYKDNAPSADGEKKRTSVCAVRKEGKLLQEIMELDGKRFESYIIGPLRIGDHGEKDTVVSIPPNDENFIFYGNSDFPHVDWVSMKYFKGVKDYEGRKVFLFSSAGDKISGNAGDASLMIDMTTQLPASYSDNAVDVRYDFLPVPTEKIVIPENFKARLLKELKYLQDLKNAGGGH